MSLNVESRPLIVLHGALNSHILRDPQWVKKFLFPESHQKGINVTIGVTLPGDFVSSTMTVEDIRLEAESGKFRISPRENSESAIMSVKNVIENLAAALPHTPLIAYDVNCMFSENANEPILQSNHAISGLLAKPSSPKSIKLECIEKYEDGMMKLSVVEKRENAQTKLFYDFSFHFLLSNNDLPSMMLLKNSILDGRIEKCLQRARDIAQSISEEISNSRTKENGKK